MKLRNMKKNSLFLALLAVLFFLSGCKDKKPAAMVVRPMADSTMVIENVPDTTVYGLCGEGTSMHSLELITTDGDTVSRGYLAYDASGATDHALDWDGGTYYTNDPNATDNEVHARARSAAKIQLNKLLANSNNKFYSFN